MFRERAQRAVPIGPSVTPEEMDRWKLEKLKVRSRFPRG
jgi:hypothetical protein